MFLLIRFILDIKRALPFVRRALAALPCMAAAATCLGSTDTLPWVRATDEGGTALTVTLRELPAAGARADTPVPLHRPLHLAVALTDGAGGAALRGVKPKVWLARQTADPPETCTDQVRRFVSGRITAKADRDFNGHLMLTLNGDASLSILNPQFSVGSTRLEALVTLPGVGADWVHLRGRDQVLVTLPRERLLMVVDVATRRVVQRIELGTHGAPRRLVVTPDEQRAFVAMDDAAELVVVDLQRGRPVVRLPIGRGLHGLALAGNGRRVVATASSDNRVSVIDAEALKVLAQHSVGGTPLSVAASALSGRVYVARANDARLAVLDPETGRLLAPANFARGVTALRADPSGRWVLGVGGREARVHVLDTASGRLLGSAGTVEQPDQVVFTARFAYVRGLSSLSMTLLDLGALARGDLATTQVPMYQRRPDAAPGEIGVADMIAPAPDGAGVLVANGADTALYAYMEGMQAPQGSYRTYSRAPRALMVIDQSMRETAPGRHETRLQLERGGRYTLAVVVDSPRLVRCFDLAVDDTGATPEGRRLDIQLEAAQPGEARAGEALPLRVRVADADTGEAVTGLTDVQVMALQLPGVAQQRRFAQEQSPGVYALTEKLPRAGTWRLTVQIASRGLAFERSPALELRVAPSPVQP